MSAFRSAEVRAAEGWTALAVDRRDRVENARAKRVDAVKETGLTALDDYLRESAARERKSESRAPRERAIARDLVRLVERDYELSARELTHDERATRRASGARGRPRRTATGVEREKLRAAVAGSIAAAGGVAGVERLAERKQAREFAREGEQRARWRERPAREEASAPKPPPRPRGTRGALNPGEPDDSGILLRERLRKGERILPVGEELPLLGRDPANCFRSEDDGDDLPFLFRLRQALRPLQIRRASGCGVLRIAGEVGVRVRHDGSVRTSGLRLCGSGCSCPTCAALIGRVHATEITTACGLWRARGGVLRMLTLTLGHERGVGLAAELHVLTMAYRRMFEGRRGQALKRALRIEFSVRGLDPMWGELNGWHLHLHVVLFMSGEPDHHLAEELARRWKESVAWALEKRRNAGHDVRGIKLPGCDRDGKERGVLLEELNRENYLQKLGLELAVMTTKRGKRGRSYNPWAIAARAAAGEIKFQRLWVEFTEAMFNARLLFWSRGAREFFGLGKEKSDQEIADAKSESPPEPLDIVITLEKEVWDQGVRRRGWREGFERATRSPTPVTAIVEYLEQNALVTRTGPRTWVASTVRRQRPGDGYGARKTIAARLLAQQRDGPHRPAETSTPAVPLELAVQGATACSRELGSSSAPRCGAATRPAPAL